MQKNENVKNVVTQTLLTVNTETLAYSHSFGTHDMCRLKTSLKQLKDFHTATWYQLDCHLISNATYVQLIGAVQK